MAPRPGSERRPLGPAGGRGSPLATTSVDILPGKPHPPSTFRAWASPYGRVWCLLGYAPGFPESTASRSGVRPRDGQPWGAEPMVTAARGCLLDQHPEHRTGLALPGDTGWVVEGLPMCVSDGYVVGGCAGERAGVSETLPCPLSQEGPQRHPFSTICAAGPGSLRGSVYQSCDHGGRVLGQTQDPSRTSGNSVSAKRRGPVWTLEVKHLLPGPGDSVRPQGAVR